jgi:hypothetical protein
MPTYELVNPYVAGSMKKTFSENNSRIAANTAWASLSKYVTNNVPRFAFTLRNVSDGKLSHFVVKEKIAKNKDVSYSIKDLDLNLSSEEEKSFAEYIKSIENKSQTIMSGGKKKDDSSSSSDSDDSDSDSDSDDLIARVRYFKNKSQPLNYLWYSPHIYSKDGTLTSVYLPSFTYPIVPYLELSLSGVLFKYNS